MLLAVVRWSQDEKKEGHQLAVDRFTLDPLGATGQQVARLCQLRNGGVGKGEPTPHSRSHFSLPGFQPLEAGSGDIFFYKTIIKKDL